VLWSRDFAATLNIGNVLPFYEGRIMVMKLTVKNIDDRRSNQDKVEFKKDIRS